MPSKSLKEMSIPSLAAAFPLERKGRVGVGQQVTPTAVSKVTSGKTTKAFPCN